MRKLVPFALCSFIGLLLHSCSQTMPVGDPDNGGLALPDGFEALVVVDSVGRARHLAVRNNGDIYVKLRIPGEEGENVALRDHDGDGKADEVVRWGHYGHKGRYGNAMRIHDGYLYLSTAGEVYRHRLRRRALLPEEPGELLLVDDYHNATFGYEHIAKPIAFDNQGHMYIPFGSPGDCCQVENRRPESIGKYPCPELQWHGGVWQFDADRPDQRQSDGTLYATGIRSIVGMEWNKEVDALFVMQHGRDNMFRTWPKRFSQWESSLLPAEELLRVDEGSDAGWPYTYFNQLEGKKLLNPEYEPYAREIGDPLQFNQPLVAFPGHFGPNDLHFYQGDQFPKRYKKGAFVAFHGSTIRAPYPQGGYFIAFVPFKDGAPSGPWEVFANGFAGIDTIRNTSDALYRPMGLAEGPDGSLYISESEKGKIWRIMYKGDPQQFGPENLAEMETHKQKPNIKDPDPIKDNLDKGRIIAGQAMYETHCAACHLSDGKGDGTRYPPLYQSPFVSGSPRELISIALKGMSGTVSVNDQSFDGTMPGFSYLSDEEIAQILSYIRTNFDNNAPSIQAVEVQVMRRRIELQDEQPEEGI